jgi:hypothetical protein
VVRSSRLFDSRKPTPCEICAGWLAILVIGTSTASSMELRVAPESVELSGANRRQQILVTGITDGGREVDLTLKAKLAVHDIGTARLDGTRVVGVSEGRTRVSIEWEGARIEVPVHVHDFDVYPPVHFVNDVVPVLTKVGCNSGGCHGKASGQNGFKLSVFGFDPAADFRAIVKEARGRRIFPASPRRSLLLAKPAGIVPHGGGQRFDDGSREWEVLFHWIRQGVPVGTGDAPRLVGLEVLPRERVVTFGARQQILATATYSDGSHRDVTASSVYTSNNERVASVDRDGSVRTAKVPGEAAITVQYMGQVAAVLLQVPRPDRPHPFPRLPVSNFIDELVGSKLEKMGIVPSEGADDATILRRMYIDTIGSLPTPEEARAFLADDRPDRRARLITHLLERPELADYWSLKWADLLLVDSQKIGGRGAYEFHRWLREQFARNRPYDEWVRELITATGSSSRNGPVNFYRAARTPGDAARAVSQVFLGVRIECAQCHHHPFEIWSREDFYGFAGFFNGIQRRATRGGRELVFHAGLAEMKMPVSGKLVPTRTLGGTPLSRGEGKFAGSDDPRVELARWMTAPGNPWFAKLAVNRVWKHFLGRGIVEPEDDLRSTNPPTNPPLLDALARRFVASGYDSRALIRVILESRVYQLSGTPTRLNAGDQQSYSRYYAKRLPAEVMLDAIGQVAGVSLALPGRPVGTRALEVWDNRLPSYFLDIFGRPKRASPCECGRSSEPTMAQALHLMNAPEIEAMISSPVGRVARLMAEGADERRIVDELCLAALARAPSTTEREVARQLFASAPRKEAAEDFLWTLLNSYEFLFVD